MYLKEGPYTGPNTWSQGEDSGLEESLADSNSQRSHDRATPESLPEDTLLPKISDLLNVPPGPDVEDTKGRAKRPPIMAITMATNDGTTGIGRTKKSEEAPGIHSPLKPRPDDDGSYRRAAGGALHYKPNGLISSYPHRQTEIEDPKIDQVPKSRFSNGYRSRPALLTRRQVRGASKERGGTQLPTWAETRTTRLRRSRALGEDKTNSNASLNRKSNTQKIAQNEEKVNNLSTDYRLHIDTEYEADEEDAGRFLMERIRATSRTLQSRLSSHSRRHVSDTGSGLRSEAKGPAENEDERLQNSISSNYRGNFNGVYTMHTRRNLRGGTGDFGEDARKDRERHQNQSGVSIENTSIKLIGGDGTNIDVGELVDYKGARSAKGAIPEEPEIAHLHMLATDGVDARESAPSENPGEPDDSREEITVVVQDTSADNLQQENTSDKINNIQEESDDKIVNEPENVNKDAENEVTDADTSALHYQEGAEATLEASDNPNYEEGTKMYTTEGAPGSENTNEGTEVNYSSDLQEGHLVNRNGKLTIEVEVKELENDGSSQTQSPPATSAADTSGSVPTPQIEIDDNIVYDSYRVYSEQNLPASTEPEEEKGPSGRRYSKEVISRTGRTSVGRGKMGLERHVRQQQPRGIYLRRMEHRDRSSNIRRTQSDENGLASEFPPVHESSRTNNIRGLSQTRRGGIGTVASWTTTSSTGDLRESAWQHGYDKDQLLLVLEKIRAETRTRERQREELLRKIKQLQSRANQRREQVREMWRKRFVEAKKITPRLEEECSRLRQELEKLHRELLSKVQAGVWALLTISGKTERPSNKLSYKIMIARSLQEIEDLTRRVEGTRLKLHTELKLRAMAEKDVRSLREELLKKKIQVTLTRNQEQAAMGSGIRQQYFISAV